MFSKQTSQSPPQKPHIPCHCKAQYSFESFANRILEILHFTYPKQTIKPSKTLKPSLTYEMNPKAVSFMIISMEKMKLKMRLLTSTTLVSVSGWSWYSILILKVLIKMQRRMNCWKRLCSTKRFKRVWIRVNDWCIPFQHADRNLKT